MILRFLFSFGILLLCLTPHVHAAMCDETETSTPKVTTNTHLQTFIAKTQSGIAQGGNSPASQGACTQASVEKILSTAKDMENDTSFGIDNFIFSFSSFLNNTCRQRDAEKLLLLIDAINKRITTSAYECKNIDTLLVARNNLIAVMKFIRDHQTDGNETIPGMNIKLSELWNEELYKNGSEVCPTESWGEVKNSWCKLQKNVETFSLTGEVTALFDKDRIARDKEIAHTNALNWYKQNLPLFLKIKTPTTESDNTNILRSTLRFLLAPISNSIDTLNSTFFPGSSTQEVSTTYEAQTQSTLKLFQVQDMLTKISDNYRKTYKAEVFLEKTIEDWNTSIDRMTVAQGEEKNLSVLLKKIKRTEDKQPKSCSVSL